MISVKVSMKEDSSALVACGSCNLRQEYLMTRKKEPIDIYNEFIDKFMSSGV
jgi:transcription elongation factor Elf1